MTSSIEVLLDSEAERGKKRRGRGVKKRIRERDREETTSQPVTMEIPSKELLQKVGSKYDRHRKNPCKCCTAPE